jgi:NADPH-dependent curcumin reductase CurA
MDNDVGQAAQRRRDATSRRSGALRISRETIAGAESRSRVFRVRNVGLSIDPAQRGWVNVLQSFPFFEIPVAIGAVMRAPAIGLVIEP